MARVDVGREATPDVAARQHAPEDLARPRIVERRARRAERDRRLLVLVNAEHLEPGPRRIEIADVQRVAVPQAVENRPLPSSSMTIEP